MKPIATRLLLVFVSMVVLLSCAATVSRVAEPGHGAPHSRDKVLLTRPAASEPADNLEVATCGVPGGGAHVMGEP